MSAWNRIVPCACLALLACAPVARAAAREDEERARIERTIRTAIEWAVTKDTLALYDAFARDSSLFFFNPDRNTTRGFAAFRRDVESVFLDPRFRAVGSAFDELRITRSPAGDAAWFSCRLTDHNTWEGRPANWDDVRWTGVLERRHGRWVIVQMHFSKAEEDVATTARAGGRFTTLTGPYLGQRPPGAQAEPFARGFVCTAGNERDIAITPDGREIYFGVMFPQLTTIVVTRLEEGHWTDPVVAPFAADARYHHFEPALSADGRRLVFMSTRPTAGEEPKPGWTNQNLFAVDRRDDGTWGEPYDLGAPVNTTDNEFSPSLTSRGTLYFTRSKPRGHPVIVRSRLVDGRYQAPDTLPAAVNGRGAPYNAFVAPDESYLVACVDGRMDLPGGGPRYMVFFRSTDDTWSEGVDLADRAPVRNGNAGSPYVSPDGRWFFFGTSAAGEPPAGGARPLTLRALREYAAQPGNGNMDIHWMDAAFLKTLQPARGD